MEPIGRQKIGTLVDGSTNKVVSLSAYRDAQYLFEALEKMSPGEQTLFDVVKWCEELDQIDAVTDKVSCASSTS